MQFEKIAQVLSRIAALQGRSIPLHRFHFYALSLDTPIEFNKDSLSKIFQQIWTSVVTEGDFEVVNKISSKDQFPLVWLSENFLANPQLSEDICMLRGATSQHWIGEDSSGNEIEKSLSSLDEGLLLRLVADKEDAKNIQQTGSKPTTATEWFIHAITRRKKVFFDGAVATLLTGLFGLATSLYSMQVYDRVIPLKSYSTLTVLTIGVSISILFELLMKHIRASMIEYACKAIDHELSGVFFSKALSIRLDARPRTVGTFAAQIRNFESVRSFMTSTTLMVIADVPLACFFLFVIFLIAGWLVCIPLIAIPMAIGIGLLFKKPIHQLTSEQINESNHKNGLLIEAIDGIESIKASGSEWKVSSKWNALTKLLSAKELKLRLLTHLSSQLTQTIHQLTYVAIIAGGSFLVAEGHLTMGGLLACSIISSRALQPIAQLPSVIAQWQSASVSLKALDNIMQMPDDRPRDQHSIVPQSCQGELRIERLKFQYDINQTVIDINALRIKPGERIAIIGAVGSGKSTLIKLLTGLYRPTQGHIYLDNIESSQISSEYLREQIGYLPQEVRLFEGSLRENLTLGLPNPTDETILKAAATCGLAKAIAQHPKGLDLKIHEGGRGLSGGQRQLVGLTRMLIAQPALLMMDEPTASLDNQLEEKVLGHLFQQLPISSTVIMSTHKMNSLKYVDRILFMQQGTISLDGPRDEVLRKINTVPVAS